MTWLCGVEEAGRGPVIGPMVMAACWVEDEELVKATGAKDSKQLTPEQRAAIFEKLTDLKQQKKIDFEITILTPQEIDAAVEGASDNLNKLELRTSAVLINAALRRANISRVLIDCPTVSTQKYAAAVKMLVDEEKRDAIEIIAENKADEHYPIVGAASILAKVTRDREIEKLKEKFKTNFGSGYPADPLTQQFLRKNYAKKEFAGIFRKSWASYKVLVQQSSQKSLFSFNYGDEEHSPQKTGGHKKELQEFEVLRKHGFDFIPPTNEYEILRMKSDDATIIKYTTGKLIAQGKGKIRTEKLLKKLNLV